MPSAVPALTTSPDITLKNGGSSGRAWRPRFRGSASPSLAALVLVTGVGALATDTYVAALPDLQRSLATSSAVAQLTMTAFIVGVAVGQLLFGPISDARGRRPLILASCVAFAVASAVCAVAPNGSILIGARLVEGLAAGCALAVGRATVSDRLHGRAAAALYGTLMAIGLLGPVVAPAIGAGILAVGTWRLVFGFLAVTGVAMVVAAVVGLPETLPPAQRHPLGLAHALGRMGDLLRDRAFRSPVVIQCLATAGFFTYIGGSSFVLQNELGLSRGQYSAVFTTNAAAMALASLVFRTTVMRLGPERLRAVGLVMSAAATVLLLGLAVAGGSAHPVGITSLWVLLGIMVAGMGLSIPATTAMAQEAGRRFGGSASALTGGLTFLVGAAATPLTGLIGHQTVTAMAALMAVFFALALALLLVGRRATAAAGRRGTATARRG